MWYDNEVKSSRKTRNAWQAKVKYGISQRKVAGVNLLLHPCVWKKPSKPACGPAVLSDHLYFLSLREKFQMPPLRKKQGSPQIRIAPLLVPLELSMLNYQEIIGKRELDSKE